MSSGLSSPLGVAGVISVVIGIIMAVVGIILLLVDQNYPKPWYTWFLLIVGVVLGIAGGIMMAIALSERTKNECCVENGELYSTVKPQKVTLSD